METPLSVKLCTEHGDTESDSLCAALKLSFKQQLEPERVVLPRRAELGPRCGEGKFRSEGRLVPRQSQHVLSSGGLRNGPGTRGGGPRWADSNPRAGGEPSAGARSSALSTTVFTAAYSGKHTRLPVGTADR